MGDVVKIFRSAETQEKYDKHRSTGILDRECPLCTRESIKKFTHWRIIENNFPYDLIAQKHNMLVPVRHASEEELTQEELDELFTIKEEYVHLNYDYILEATHRKKSIPAHFHLHLLILKDAT